MATGHKTPPAGTVRLGNAARCSSAYGVPLYESSPGEFDRFASLAARRYADTRKFRAMEAQEIRDFIAAGELQS